MVLKGEGACEEVERGSEKMRLVEERRSMMVLLLMRVSVQYCTAVSR